MTTVTNNIAAPPAADAPVLATPAAPSAWSPLRIAIFRSLWVANLVALIGTWALEAGGPWLMRMFTHEKWLIASVTATGSAALCLLSLPAGVLADLLDRRRLLILSQLWRFVAAGTLALLYYLGPVNPQTSMGMHHGPFILLTFIFLLYFGTAVANPAFQYVVPELVPPGEMSLAIGLNSMALNLARAAGPAIGMLLVKYAGIGACILFCAFTSIGVAWVLWRWEGHVQKPAKETFGVALKTAFSFTIHSRAMRSILLRVFLFIFFASCLWGLIQPFAESFFGKDPLGLMLVMVFLGLGAVGGVFLMPMMERRFGLDGGVAVCTAGFALGMVLLGLVHIFWLDLIILSFLGMNWVIVPSNFNFATQRSVPGWVKGRAISMYLTVLFGSLACAALWGKVSDQTSVSKAMVIAGCGIAAGLLLVKRFPLAHAPPGTSAPATAVPVQTLYPLYPPNGMWLERVLFRVDGEIQRWRNRMR